MKRMIEWNRRLVNRSALQEFLDNEGEDSRATIEASARDVADLIAINEIIGYWYEGTQYTTSVMNCVRKDINYTINGSPIAGAMTFASFALDREVVGTSTQLQFEFFKNDDTSWTITIWMQEV